MGLLDFFGSKKSRTNPDSNAMPKEQGCYDVAYFILPRYVFGDFSMILKNFRNTPRTAGLDYYVLACQMRDIEPDIEYGMEFRWHHGQFDSQRQYLALEYPPPSPFSMDENDMFEISSSKSMSVLAPYYSIVTYGDEPQREYFTLGQAPTGGATTVRQVTEDGANCNLGPGPTPSLENFLAAIKQRRPG